jgi:NAD(P)-dependent dehydrogenase (short-subunit alcohol dehydrogenase family)
MLRLKNKIAIITGGAQGIGKSVALSFAKEGASIAICDINEKEGKNVIKAIKRKKRDAIFIKCDVSNEEDVNNAVKSTLEYFKKIDILVNNAGVMNTNPIEKLNLEDWDKTMAVNLRGTFLFSKAVLPFMKKRKYGKIINISSLAGRTGGIMVGVDYSASKGGILAFTKALARELAPYNINVNAICPGTTKTEMIKKFSPRQIQELRNKIPLGRLGEPEDVALCALFLASDESNYITGATIDVNGGLLMI